MTVNLDVVFDETTIIPKDPEQQRIWLNKFYEDTSNALANKKDLYFKMNLTSTATDIPQMPTFGSFIIMVSGLADTFPAYSAALSKSTSTGAGSVSVLDSQIGTGTWAGVDIVVNAATSFQIAHNGAATLNGDFIIRILGTRAK